VRGVVGVFMTRGARRAVDAAHESVDARVGDVAEKHRDARVGGSGVGCTCATMTVSCAVSSCFFFGFRFRRAAVQIQILSTHCVVTPRDSVGDDGYDKTMTMAMTMRARVGGRAGYRIDVLDDADGVGVRRA